MYIADNRDGELEKLKHLSCVVEYTDNNMEIIDFVERAYETAKTNRERALSGENMDSVPLMVVVLNSPKAPDKGDAFYLKGSTIKRIKTPE